jgi:hypothetical protein
VQVLKLERAPRFECFQIVARQLLDGLFQFACEERSVGAHAQQDFFAQFKHVSGHYRGVRFNSIIPNAANSDIVPLANVKFLTLRAGEAL